ncbi:MAG: rane protein, partial [Bacteroidetes bacterium]|nr:rane protein [Bacteroidota bacterium]
MKNEILAFLNDPEQLEKMYRSNKILFKKEFALLYPEIIGNPVADTWNERLNYESDAINWGNGKELF